MIQSWLNTGCNYKEGIDIYSQLPHNKNLLRLFRLRETKYNREKLKSELTKYLMLQKGTSALKKNIESADIKKEFIPKLSNIKPIAYYPQELHPVYQKRNFTYYEACSKKIKLNSLSEDQQIIALQLQTEIFELWKVNDRCFEILTHYEQTKRILPWKTEKNYSSLTPQQLVNERQRLYSAVSKRKKTILALQKAYESESQGKRKKQLFERLNNKIEELQEKNLQIDLLNKKIKS